MFPLPSLFYVGRMGEGTPFKRRMKWGLVMNAEDELSERDAILRAIGFPSYRIYLQSELWGSIRKRVLRRTGRKCHLCELPASSVHHSKYTEENLRGNSLEFLHPVCDDCHELLHFDGKMFVDLEETRSRTAVFEADQWKTAVVPSGSRMGQTLGSLSYHQIAGLWGSWNKEEELRQSSFFALITEAKRHKKPPKKHKRKKRRK